MKNLYLLKTNKPSRLVGSRLNLSLKDIPISGFDAFKTYNIYITSNEEINPQIKPCWCVNTIKNTWNDDIVYYQGAMPQYHYIGFKKIILTTDQKLIKDGVQEIDDEFLEWFVKNPSCEKVDVKDNYVCSNCNEDINNPKYQTCHGNYRSHKIFKIIIPKEEPKQETLEEVCNKVNFINPRERVAYYNGLKNGAKWQQEQEQNNENSWFNEYQEVEDYIIERIGDKFLEATPEKYNTASEATIALLENNWKQEQDENLYSEEDLREAYNANENGWVGFDFWFEQFKKK